MRILMVHSFHHPRGGDSTAVAATRALLEEAGHVVIPFAMRHPDDDPDPWRAHFAPHRDPRALSGPTDALRLIWNTEAAAALARLLPLARPDVAHVHHLHRHLSPSVLYTLHQARVPIVWTLHDHELICPEGHRFDGQGPCHRCAGGRYHEAVIHRCKDGARGPSLAVAIEKAIHRALPLRRWVSTFLAPSQHLADLLIEDGLPARQIAVLPNPVEPLAPATGPRQGWVVAARFTREKGLDTAIAAARRLPHIPLTLCGGGPLEGALRAAAPPHVRFTGPLPRPELLQELGAAAVVALPSRWPENAPYAVIEPQLLGTPVVAAAVGGVPALLTHGESGLLVPPDDPAALAAAVVRLHEDPALAARLAAAARAAALRRHDPALLLDALLHHYAAAR